MSIYSKLEADFKTQGFTLIEILIVMGLITLMAGTSLVFSLDCFRQNIFLNETQTVLALLARARGQALNNINNNSHGLKVEPNSYIIFQGPDYDHRDTAQDEIFDASSQVLHSGLSEVVFSPLSGEAEASGGNLVLHQNPHPDTIISINLQGTIDW